MKPIGWGTENGSKDHTTSVMDGCQDQAWTKDKLMDPIGLEGFINYYLSCTNAKSYEKNRQWKLMYNLYQDLL